MDVVTLTSATLDSPAMGAVSIADNKLHYVPAQKHGGAFGGTYTITDAAGKASTYRWNGAFSPRDVQSRWATANLNDFYVPHDMGAIDIDVLASGFKGKPIPGMGVQDKPKPFVATSKPAKVPDTPQTATAAAILEARRGEWRATHPYGVYPADYPPEYREDIHVGKVVVAEVPADNVKEKADAAVAAKAKADEAAKYEADKATKAKADVTVAKKYGAI